MYLVKESGNLVQVYEFSDLYHGYKIILQVSKEEFDKVKHLYK